MGYQEIWKEVNKINGTTIVLVIYTDIDMVVKPLFRYHRTEKLVVLSFYV